MDMKKKFGATDPHELAEWFKYDDAELFIAPQNTIAFRNATLRTFNVRDIRDDGLDDRTAMEVVELESAIKASTVLLDWKGIYDNDKEVPYSIDTAKSYLMLYDDFRIFVDDKSTELTEKKDKQTTKSKKK